MLIKSLIIDNYRCYQHQEIDFERLTAILGRNGGGKTTILSALEEFYNTKNTISNEDFYNRDTSLTIKIRVVFSDFREGPESDTFEPYINNDQMSVTKVISCTDTGVTTKYLASTLAIPQFAQVRAATTKTKQVEEFNQIADSGALPGLVRLPARGADVDAAIANYEQTHPESRQWIESEVSFFGAKNIGAGILDKFTKFVRVPAVRDVMDDVVDKKGSPIHQLLDMIVMRRIESREDIQKLREEFGARVREVYSPGNLVEIKDLESDINGILTKLAPNAGLNLSWDEPKLPELPLPALITHLIEDGFSGSIDRKGHGVQRALTFSLIQQLALAQPPSDNPASEQLPQENPIQAEAQQIPESHENTGVDLILAIDEPELYQHPLRSRHLASVLRQMSTATSTLGGRNQIIFTTHSPYFISLQDFREIRIVRKCQPVDGGMPPCSSVAKYSLEQAAREMARVNKDESEEALKKYTSASFFAHTYPIMTTIICEGFFAEGVVLVEGLTEVAFLSTLATRLGKDWAEKSLAIIPASGKNNLDRIGIIFKGLDIPTYIIFDGDNDSTKEKEREKVGATNQRLLRLANAALEEEYPKDGAFSGYACFEDKIESYCKKHLGEEFYNSILRPLANEYSYDKLPEALKNFEIACEFVTRVYDSGRNLPLIEKMVEEITLLVS